MGNRVSWATTSPITTRSTIKCGVENEHSEHSEHAKHVVTPRVLALIPPMTQLNTPYPSTAYLTGFLRSRGVSAVQEDLALALVLRLFSPDGLSEIREAIRALPKRERSPLVRAFDREFDAYQATIAPAVAFLQGRDPSMGHRIDTDAAV